MLNHLFFLLIQPTDIVYIIIIIILQIRTYDVENRIITSS